MQNSTHTGGRGSVGRRIAAAVLTSAIALGTAGGLALAVQPNLSDHSPSSHDLVARPIITPCC